MNFLEVLDAWYKPLSQSAYVMGKAELRETTEEPPVWSPVSPEQQSTLDVTTDDKDVVSSLVMVAVS